MRAPDQARRDKYDDRGYGARRQHGLFSRAGVRPGDDGYDAERAGFNLTVDHHPELIVGAAGPEDVAAAVSYAAARGLAVGC